MSTCIGRFNLKQFDTAPTLKALLLEPGKKTPQNLTGATIRLSIRPTNGSAAAVIRNATIDGDPLLGIARYDWVDADTLVAGMFNAEWLVTLPGGREATWPNDSYMHIDIEARLDPTDASPTPAPTVGVYAVIVSLDGIATGAAQLVSLPTTGLANGSLAWCQASGQFFRLDASSTATVDGTTVVAALNGGRWLEFGGGGTMSADIALTVPANPGAGGTAIIFDTTMVAGVTLSQRAAMLDVREVLVAIKTDVAARFYTAWLDPTTTAWTINNEDAGGPGEAIVASTPFSRIVTCVGLDTLIYVTTPAGPPPALWQVMARTSQLRSA